MGRSHVAPQHDDSDVRPAAYPRAAQRESDGADVDDHTDVRDIPNACRRESETFVTARFTPFEYPPRSSRRVAGMESRGGH